jgi:hypothetical protein
MSLYFQSFRAIVDYLKKKTKGDRNLRFVYKNIRLSRKSNVVKKDITIEAGKEKYLPYNIRMCDFMNIRFAGWREDFTDEELEKWCNSFNLSTILYWIDAIQIRNKTKKRYRGRKLRYIEVDPESYPSNVYDMRARRSTSDNNELMYMGYKPGSKYTSTNVLHKQRYMESGNEILGICFDCVPSCHICKPPKVKNIIRQNHVMGKKFTTANQIKYDIQDMSQEIE